MITKVKRKPKRIRTIRLREEDIDAVQRLANKLADGNFNAMIEAIVQQSIHAKSSRQQSGVRL